MSFILQCAANISSGQIFEVEEGQRLQPGNAFSLL